MLKKYENISFLIVIILASIFLFLHVYGSIIAFFFFILQLILPILCGFSIAFILYPIFSFFKKNGVNTAISILVIYLSIIYTIMFFIANFIPLINEQINSLQEIIPLIRANIESFLSDNGWDLNAFTFPNFFNSFFLDNLPMIAGQFTTYLGILFLSPFLSLYFLIYYESISNSIKRYLEKTKHFLFLGFCKDLRQELISYVGGLFLVVLILFLATSIVFALTGVPYSLIFGLIVGITNIIPFVGPYIGALIVFLFCLSDSFFLGIKAIVIISILQIIEANFLTPFVQGKMIKKNPLLILLSFTIFGGLFGFFGMVLAVPLLSLTLLIAKYLFIFFGKEK